MTELEQRECPDCNRTMDILISIGKPPHYICGNVKCKPYNDPFDRYQDKLMDALDIMQEMEVDDGDAN